MFGVFNKRKPEPQLRRGVEIGEMRENALTTVVRLADLGGEIHSFQQKESNLAEVRYKDLNIQVPIVLNLLGLRLYTSLDQCNIHQCGTVTEKAFAYRCIDHVCNTCAGVRAFFDPDSGALTIGVQSAGFDEQYRADTLIDVALFMLEEGVMEARRYLGLPFTDAERPRVTQWQGGFHYGEGFKTFPTATEAFARFLEKKYQCREVTRDATSILLKSGPVQYDVRFFGWRFGYMVTTATREFKHAYQHDERYVRLQERLARPVQGTEPASDLAWNFRDPERSAVAYFQPDGTFVVGEYGFGNIDTDRNGAAFDRVTGAQMLNVKFMTFLAEELSDDLYSDELNRPT
ncbi:hypothetical protein GCM10008955_19560 [Deinococcus malanensis]|uniref:Uncharacterized protein n=1 Tax=Deinococcus malanensis TaxID=1706855 RepID=A0ABQ2EX49_9DEIO|nr:hypothetical protein [Deinococcus malanensis]GGK25902.1 hypothetical protein GCM10008955_19560 [Deinococcus malanensis]